ncbi:MAG TPA: site-specific integrase, partial [Chitinophagaceae bacterium]|nr:site-specific integrase [Chitinophagaceae bacterium]
MQVTQQNSTIVDFLNYIKFEKRYSLHTVIAYQTDLEQFFVYINAQYDSPTVQSINSMMIRSWLACLKGDEKLSAKSLNRKISSLKTFFRHLLKNQIITQTPMSTVVAPKISKRLPVFVQENNLETLFNHVEFTNNWKGKTEQLVLQIFYHTGIRLSELIQLKTVNIDFYYQHIKVLGKGNKERIIPISKELLSDIKEYISLKPEAIKQVPQLLVTEKGTALQPRSVYAMVKKYLS